MSLFQRVADLPQRLLLVVISAAVLIALTVAAGWVALAAWRLRRG